MQVEILHLQGLLGAVDGEGGWSVGKKDGSGMWEGEFVRQSKVQAVGSRKFHKKSGSVTWHSLMMRDEMSK